MTTTALPDQAAARDRLQARLEDGDRRIVEAQQAGQETTTWEDFWITLRHDSEALCRAIDDSVGSVVSPGNVISPQLSMEVSR